MMYLTTGTTLQAGKYRIIHTIGAGGFGCTYLAEDTQSGQQVAIKEFFPKDFCERVTGQTSIVVSTKSKANVVETLKRKFLGEGKKLYEMQHRYIVHVRDIFEENNTAYYVMNYIQGQSVLQILNNQGPLLEGKALKYIRQIADALNYVHQKNILHLDIKPGNIMIDQNDNAILIDFGAAKHYNEETGENTTQTQGIYTDIYAPYEQINRLINRFSAATDIYSLGCTLFVMLTNDKPIKASLVRDGERQKTLPSSISPNVRNAVSKAMADRVNDRPQNISQFLSLLDGYSIPSQHDDSTIIDTPPISRPTSNTSRSSNLRPPQQPKGNSSKGLIIVLVLVVVAAIIGGVIYLSNNNRDYSISYKKHVETQSIYREGPMNATSAKAYIYMDLKFDGKNFQGESHYRKMPNSIFTISGKLLTDRQGNQKAYLEEYSNTLGKKTGSYVLDPDLRYGIFINSKGVRFNVNLH